jgi:hypothetical protein
MTLDEIDNELDAFEREVGPIIETADGDLMWDQPPQDWPEEHIWTVMTGEGDTEWIVPEYRTIFAEGYVVCATAREPGRQYRRYLYWDYDVVTPE